MELDLDVAGNRSAGCVQANWLTTSDGNPSCCSRDRHLGKFGEKVPHPVIDEQCHLHGQ